MRWLLTFSFPLIMVTMEWCLRVAAHTDTSSFIAPSIAAASCGLALPLATRPSERNLFANPRSESGDSFLATGQLTFLLTLLTWMWCVVLTEMRFEMSIFFVNLPTVLAIASFLLSAAMSILLRK